MASDSISAAGAAWSCTEKSWWTTGMDTGTGPKCRCAHLIHIPATTKVHHSMPQRIPDDVSQQLQSLWRTLQAGPLRLDG